MAKTNKEQYDILMSELATTIKSLTNSTGKLTLDQIVTKAKQITPAPTLDGNATVNQVLKDATFYNTDPNTKLSGTIETFTPSKVTSNGTLQTSGKYVNSDIVVEVPSPTLDGDAEASNVLAGKTFYSNSITKQTGIMYNVGQDIGTINNTEYPRYNIAEGYHNGTGYVQINPSQIVDCVAENILQGKTILQVQGTLVKGITPSGKKTITSTAETDVTNFATAQVVDSNLVASNIKKNVSILGITGTLEEGITPTGTLDITSNGTKDVTNYASVNVNVPLPTLNAPTISLSNSTVTITNPVTNGSFVSGYDVYKDGTLLTSITLATVDLSTLITDSGTYTITVKAKGTNFNESVASNLVSYVVQSISYEVTITQLSSTVGYGTIDNVYDGQNSSGTLLGSGTGTYTTTTGYLYIECSTANGGGEYVNGYCTGGVTYVEETTSYGLYKVTGNGTIEINVGTCLTGDTLITLVDGSQKRIDEITLNDKVLSYNPNTMKLEEDNIIYCDSNLSKEFIEYDIWTFENGTIIKTVHRHRLYNVEKQRMVYMDEWQLGEHAININGEKVKLINHENIKEQINHYTIFTNNQNYFANGLLAGNRHTKKLNL